MTEFGKKVRDLLLSGCDINFGRVSICNLNNYTSRRGWQVFSDDARARYMAIYNEDELEGATDKFCWLVSEIKRIKSERTQKPVRASATL